MTAQPPPSPGRYWYDCLFLPDGVRAELVTLGDKPGVRFCFTTIKQAGELALALRAFAENKIAGQWGEDIEPPLVGENNV